MIADLIREITDDFVSAFDDGVFTGAFARVIASGLMPEGVDADDPRVVEIVAKCRAASLPITAAVWEVLR